MRSHIFYILFFLVLAGCTNKPESVSDLKTNLSPKPVVVELNLKAGYKINPLTGDSIKPLINSLGDTVKTGLPYEIKGTAFSIAEKFRPQVIKAIPSSKTIVESNIHPVQGNPEIIQVDSREDSINIELSGKTNSHINNAYGSVITGRPIPADGKIVVLHEPKPVKVLPMRFKDNATSDIQYLDAEQGLSYSYITDVHQDKNGYIWFGTDGYGVYKYDGVYLTTYTTKEGLPGNKVTEIIEDRNGMLWIGTEDGISVFDGEQFQHFTNKDGLPNNELELRLADKNNKIWMTSSIGVSCYDGKNIINYSVKEGLPYDGAHGFLEDADGIFWIGTQEGIAKFNGKEFSRFHPSVEILKLVYSIQQDRNGNLWFGSSRYGLVKYDGSVFTHYTEKNGLPHNSILSMIVDKKDNLWIATRYGGICCFDGTYFTSYSSVQGLSDDKSTKLMEDKAGNIWVCTNGGGLNKLNEQGFSEIIKPEYLGNSRVRPIIQDSKGNMWFGTESAGLYKYNGSLLERYLDKTIFGYRGFRSVMEDRKGNLWIGETDGGGFYKYDFKKFIYYLNPVSATHYLSFFEDSKNNIWLGTADAGAAVMHDGEITYFGEKEGFSYKRIFVILEDRKGYLWFGTDGGGLVKYDGKSFTVFSYREGLFAKSITSIIEDSLGHLWLGTLGSGLCKFDGEKFTYYTEKQGLSLNDVWSVKEDAARQIWAGTDRGLSVLIPSYDSFQKSENEYAIYNFGHPDGLKSTDFNLNGVCIDNNNRIWWGTGKALVTRDLNIPIQANSPLSLNINHIELNGEYFDFRNISDSLKKKISFRPPVPFQNIPGKLSLAYNQNHLGFYFSAIDWIAPHKIKYSYRLIGLDETWSTPSAEPFVDYRNLSYGEYEFQLKAIGQSQVWTEPFSYKFIIRPAWWQTWWFRILSALAIISATFLIARAIYLARLRRQKLILEKQLAVQTERQRISSEMHDDIGAGLSGIRLLTELTKNKIKDGQAGEEVEKIYQSVGDISSKMKEVIWSLNTDNDSLLSLIAYLQKQSRMMMENYPGVFETSVPESIPEIKIQGDTRRHIYLLVKEALHNTIKHSGASHVKMNISYDEVLRIVIADNGRGFNEKDTDGSGNGIKNMRRRIRQLNGIFLMQNANGLILTFEIPLK